MTSAHVSLTFLQLNDLHGQLFPHAELFWQRGTPLIKQNIGGIARIATFLRTRKQQDPDRTFIADCGDAFFGSYFTQIDQGAALLPFLNALGIDASNGGHWEYYYGPERFLELARALNYPLYALNVYKKGTRTRIFPPYGIFEKAGVKIAVLGLAATIVDDSMPASFAGNLEFTDGIAADELPALLPEVRAQADLICLISHMGLPQDIAIAQGNPGIDIIFSGHTHDRLWQPAVVTGGNEPYGDTLLISAGFSGSFIGELQLQLERTPSGRLHKQFSYRLHVIDESIPEDSTVQQQLDTLLEQHKATLTPTLGTVTTDLHRMLTFESTMDNFLLLCMQNTYRADLYVSRAWRFCPPKPKGVLTEQDLWDMVPFQVQLFEAHITGLELRAAVEKWLTNVMTTPLSQKGGYVTRQLGMHVIARINNPDGYRVQEIEIGGKPLDLTMKYHVIIAGEQVKKDFLANWTPLPQDLHTVVRSALAKGPIHSPLTHDKFIIS
ncbi:bifunctional metallophosphatase/5'-nucleotidase [Sulfoacidibacillus thermotolerans]|uniref:Bifunctional metallophosphatase/5'-nucleotidase n=1 Tax=Sulfoacidibacillus thermotolerans TaxID=1765684 RepID=A0A2U3D6M0_SULT2|nr:5'-nucleotidase C-terminal domain-containing protein [Sulfoacidibacillus thermotolerans]PWI56929.1 hypothetical protein BM613_11020 [Sulfoacidibacillus thermotolerans]